MKKATLALASGDVFEGFACGAAGEAAGEVVFNTSHTGYQEILTDPSYAGQIVTFTVAELGNYGVHHGDEQAAGPQVSGFVARRVCREPSNWRSDEPFLAWLTQFLRVSGDPIPRSRATSLIRRPRSSTSSTARRRSSSEYFRGRPIAAVSSLQARRPRNRHCIKPGVAQFRLAHEFVLVSCNQPLSVGNHLELRSL